MSRRKRLIAATLAAFIVLAIASGVATMAIPIDTLSRGRATTEAATTMLPSDPSASLAATERGFTGQYVDGVAVYRLPPVHTVASRKAELAKMEAEDRLARAADGLVPPNADASQEPASVAAVLTRRQ